MRWWHSHSWQCVIMHLTTEEHTSTVSNHQTISCWNVVPRLGCKLILLYLKVILVIRDNTFKQYVITWYEVVPVSEKTKLVDNVWSCIILPPSWNKYSSGTFCKNLTGITIYVQVMSSGIYGDLYNAHTAFHHADTSTEDHAPYLLRTLYGHHKESVSFGSTCDVLHHHIW